MKLMQWENIFANHHIFHKMLVSKVNKEFKEPKRKKNNNNIPIKDCREPEYTISKGDIQMASMSGHTDVCMIKKMFSITNHQ